MKWQWGICSLKKKADKCSIWSDIGCSGKTAPICESCWHSEKTAHFGELYLAKPRNERFLANCHVKWSAQKGIGEVSEGLCQTDGTPCCVFDWKRKVTFAATSKRQWSAKQIGLRSTPSLEQTPLQGMSEAVFQNNAMFASFLSEGRCPLFVQQRGDEIFAEVGCGVICRISNRTRSTSACFSLIATKRLQTFGKTPAAFRDGVRSPV